MLEQVPPLAHGVESLDQLHVGSFVDDEAMLTR
jgi:hypothetical protein